MDPLQSFLSRLSPSRAGSTTPHTNLTSRQSPPPTTQESRPRGHSLPGSPRDPLSTPSLHGRRRFAGSFSSLLDTYQDAFDSGSTQPPSPNVHSPTVRNLAIAIPRGQDGDLSPPPPPRLHTRLQSDFILSPESSLNAPTRGVTTLGRGRGVSFTSTDSGESSGSEPAALHAHSSSRLPSTGLSSDPHAQPGASASMIRPRPNSVVTLPLSYSPASESASAPWSLSQASLLIDSPEHPYLARPNSSSRPSTPGMTLPATRDSEIAPPGANYIPSSPPLKLYVQLQSQYTVPEFSLISESTPTRRAATADRDQGVLPTSSVAHTSGQSPIVDPSDTPGISGAGSPLAREIDEPSSVSMEPAVPREKFSITAETLVDDIISYFEKVAKLDNYTSKLNHDQPPTVQRRGGTACVYRITATDNTYLAVKCIFMQLSVDKDKTLKRSARELEVWSRLKHKNILPLLGLAKYQGHIAMVSAWMSLGSVVTFVKERPDENRYLLSQQVVEAVAYLHAQEIVHGDIKGDNVLMSDDGKPMLTDFGLTITNESHLILSTTNGGGGSWRWMAPELLGPEECRSKEADVYALGMTVLEILTGKPPFAELESLYEILDAVRRQRKTPRRPECLTPPSRLKNEFWGAMTKCWTYEPTRRAKMTEVEELIANSLDEGRQRRKLVKAILESGKAPSSGVRRINPLRGRSSDNTESQAELIVLESRVKQGIDAANNTAERVGEWATSLTEGAVRLLGWSRAFARVVDLGVPLGGGLEGEIGAVRAFTTVAASLEDLSRELSAVFNEDLVPQLRRLAKTAQGPLLLLAQIHTLPSTHHAYPALAAQLLEELPRYVDMFERAFGIIVLRLSSWQARYFQGAELRWKDFWLALNVEESEIGVGENAAVETVRIWWKRWEASARQTAGMSICAIDMRLHTQQVSPTPDSPSWNYPSPYRSKPFALSLGDLRSATSSSSSLVRGHLRTVSTDRRTRRQSDPHNGKQPPKGGNLRGVASRLFRGAPGKLSSAHSSSSRIQQPVLYTATAIHPFNPETEATHLGLPFLMLRIGDTLEILVEAGHPSEHSHLPIPYDDAPDCMLAARNGDRLEGWVLASCLMPLA